MTERRQT